ncbi:MAG: NCS2 family permease [Bacteroidales bacterium]
MLKKLFGFDPSKHSMKTEILAGITTFLTMSYILAVNPNLFALCGMPEGAVFTATALAAIVGTLIISTLAKLPFGLAPGMGLTAFFVFTVCLSMGYSWQFALTAILIEGFIFVLLTITNLREAILHAIPVTLKHAIGAGIGLFIAFIGLNNAGLVVSNESTLVTLGDITAGTGLLAVIGLAITSVLVTKNVRGSLLIGILLTTAIGIPMGLTQYNGLVSAPQSIEPIFMQFEWDQIFSLNMVVIVFTFLFVDMFDTIGTIVGVATKANMMKPDGKIPGIKQAFMADAIATIAGACFGTSTTTVYVESAAGVAQGGRTGLTALTIAICFAISLFFSPLFIAIPASATAPVLIIVGLFMMTPIKMIDFDRFSESIPAFICVVMMPLTFSISNGILLGMISYVVINVLCGKFKKINLTMYILAILFILKYIFI